MSESERNGKWTQYDEDLMEWFDASADQRPDGRLIQGGAGLGVPCLVGPTQCGKSTLVEDYCTQRGLALQTVFAGADDSTDVAGWPVRSKNSAGRPILDFTNPSIIPAEYLDSAWNGKWVLFIDELDKVPPDTLSPMLSLLAARRLRNLIVKPHSVICAMNEPKRSIHESIYARLTLATYPGPAYPLFERAELKPVEAFLGHLEPTMEPASWPERRTHPGSCHRIARWMRTRKIFWQNRGVQDLILNGCLTERDAESVRAKIRGVPDTPAIDWARSCTPTEAAAGLIYYIGTSTPEVAQAVQAELARRAGADTSGEMAIALDSFYGTRRPVSPLGALESHGDPTEDKARVKAGATLALKRFKSNWRKHLKEVNDAG